MGKARWIWYYGDYEIYHNLLTHTRRCDYEIPFPPFWSLATPYLRVNFRRTFICDIDTTIKIFSTAKGYIRLEGDTKYPFGSDIFVKAGEHTVQVETVADKGLPSIFCDSEYLKTDANWTANNGAGDYIKVGFSDMLISEKQNPEVFPFVYDEILPLRVETVNDGYLYDFGKEYFGPMEIAVDDTEEFKVLFGESLEEALDPEWAVRRVTLSDKLCYSISSGAFRYVFVNKKVSLKAWYEHLDIENVGNFVCDSEIFNKIWNISAYTFNLNSREFFLDGIKRDRWVWSGDAYQAAMIGEYLYQNQDITKRTIIALLGKPPYEQHVNTIVDYTMYVILGAYEYYYRTGDREFIDLIRNRLEKLADFLFKGLDGNGLINGGGWIFVDWADIDKDGPTCAEQILLWQTYKCLNLMYGTDYTTRMDALKTKIMKDFWSEEKGGFIDCAESGKNHVSRHPNIFAILYDFVDAEQTKKIVNCVLLNDAVTAITTPYFKFFELTALAKVGKTEMVIKEVESYWGGMVNLGATSIWEEFDPNISGIEHYSMYGRKFEKSLCHAWGSGPIPLIAKCCVGIRPTDVAYKTFEITPVPFNFKHFEAVIPIAGGTIKVVYCHNSVSVFSTVPGGVLKFGSKKINVPVGKKVCLSM